MATIIVQNPSFELGTGGDPFPFWTFADMTLNTTIAQSGTQSAQFGVTAGAFIEQTDIIIVPNNRCYISFWLFNNSVATKSVNVIVNGVTLDTITVPAATPDWLFYSYEFISVSNNTIRFAVVAADADIILLDDVAITYNYVTNGAFNSGAGTTITGWTTTGVTVPLVSSTFPEIVTATSDPLIAVDPHSELNSVSMGVTRTPIGGIAVQVGVATSVNQAGIPVVPLQDYTVSLWTRITPLIGLAALVLTVTDPSGPTTLLTVPNINTGILAGEWTLVSFAFTAGTGATVNLSLSTLVSIGLYIDDVAITPATAAAILCFSGKSIVYARDTRTGDIVNVKAEDIIAGVHEVFSTRENKFVPLLYNIISGQTTRYRFLRKGCLGENLPTEHFYATSGHTILLNGVETKMSKVPQARILKVKPETVYTFCTENGGPVLINGLEVFTYSKEAWSRHVTTNKIAWKEANKKN